VTVVPTPHDAANAAGGAVAFDLTTTALWSGPPAGIVRVESGFARWAMRNIDALTPAFFDAEGGGFRSIDRSIAIRLATGQAIVDPYSFVDPARRGKRRTDRIPPALRGLASWLMQSRRMALQSLERLRVTTRNAALAQWVDRLQRLIMSAKYRALMVRADGSRRDCLPVDLLMGPPISLGAPDTLVCTGAGWMHDAIGAIVAAKQHNGFRFVLYCHDIIPLMFPGYFLPADVAAYRSYWNVAFHAADLVIFGSRTVASDAKAYCGACGIALTRTAVCRLGADLAEAAATSLPVGLDPGRFALLVSTIEPRKGHRLIYEVWTRLLAAGVPQRTGFKLVFAGRVGWMVEDLMRDLRDGRLGGTVCVLTDADDARIAALYRDAAFCLYPSRYEGFGLPAIEAFRHGKAVLASTGGALPELIGDLSPCLDPDDAEAWQRTLQAWIEDPSARALYEERIRTSFRHPDWDESARAFFALAAAAEGKADG
jgi:glycosyltransferase involved in cell wall biosynthesis